MNWELLANCGVFSRRSPSFFLHWATTFLKEHLSWTKSRDRQGFWPSGFLSHIMEIFSLWGPLGLGRVSRPCALSFLQLLCILHSKSMLLEVPCDDVKPSGAGLALWLFPVHSLWVKAENSSCWMIRRKRRTKPNQWLRHCSGKPEALGWHVQNLSTLLETFWGHLMSSMVLRALASRVLFGVHFSEP